MSMRCRRITSYNVCYTKLLRADDKARIELVQDYVAGHIDKHWIESLTAVSTRSRLLSPPAFSYNFV